MVGKLLTKFVGQKRNQRWQQIHYSAGNQESQPIDHDDNDDNNYHDYGSPAYSRQSKSHHGGVLTVMITVGDLLKADSHH